MTIEPEPSSSTGSTDDDECRGQSLSRFPARAIGNLSGLAPLPRPVPGRRRPARQWASGVTILLPRLNQLTDSSYSHGGVEHRHGRPALTVRELSLVLAAAAGGAWSHRGLPDCLELEVFAFRVQGVAPACYRYLPVSHALGAPMELRQRLRHGESSVPEAAMSLVLTSRPASPSEPPVSPFTPTARLAASLVANAAIAAAARLGLNSQCCKGQHERSYRVAIRPPSGPQERCQQCRS